MQKTQKELVLRQRIIYLTSALLLLVLLSLWMLYRSFIKEKKIKQALAAQNTDIAMLNDRLKLLLHERTGALELRNQQIEEYAFCNAHILRRLGANTLDCITCFCLKRRPAKRPRYFRTCTVPYWSWMRWCSKFRKLWRSKYLLYSNQSGFA